MAVKKYYRERRAADVEVIGLIYEFFKERNFRC